MKNRVELLNTLIELKGYRRYLEIGCANDATFRRVNAPHKVGVDPARGGTLRMTSDDFFKVNAGQFDLIFIDGLHLAEQVLKDVENSLEALSSGGCIVLHDCLPEREEHQLRQPMIPEWTGDVWKAVVQLRARADLDLCVLESDWGLGILFRRPNSGAISAPAELNWNVFTDRHNELLRVVDVPQSIAFVAGSSSHSLDHTFSDEGMG